MLAARPPAVKYDRCGNTRIARGWHGRAGAPRIPGSFAARAQRVLRSHVSLTVHALPAAFPTLHHPSEAPL